jgi:very-short-patch-repair endonuclease
MDVHAMSCTLTIVGPSGRQLKSDVIETNGQALIEYLRAIPQPRHLCFEERTQSAWLHEILSGFRRQVPLGRFVADFAAPAAGLVVEVDGRYHAARRSADAQRDRSLARMGYRVLRLEAALVLQQPLVALARVHDALER